MLLGAFYQSRTLTVIGLVSGLADEIVLSHSYANPSGVSCVLENQDWSCLFENDLDHLVADPGGFGEARCKVGLDLFEAVTV